MLIPYRPPIITIRVILFSVCYHLFIPMYASTERDQSVRQTPSTYFHLTKGKSSMTSITRNSAITKNKQKMTNTKMNNFRTVHSIQAVLYHH